jgi:predicted GNAT family N-acyltransferase
MPAKIMPRAKDLVAAARLWEISTTLTRVSFGGVTAATEQRIQRPMKSH